MLFAVAVVAVAVADELAVTLSSVLATIGVVAVSVAIVVSVVKILLCCRHCCLFHRALLLLLLLLPLLSPFVAASETSCYSASEPKTKSKNDRFVKAVG